MTYPDLYTAPHYINSQFDGHVENSAKIWVRQTRESGDERWVHESKLTKSQKRIGELVRRDHLWSHEVTPKLNNTILELEQKLSIALSAINQTLEENGHLADGDSCTLIVLKRAYEQITNTIGESDAISE